MFKSGLRQGWGVVSSPDHDILALTGDWNQGWLEDKVRLVTKNTTVFEGWCHQSSFHGPIRKIEMKKFRMFKQQGEYDIFIDNYTILHANSDMDWLVPDGSSIWTVLEMV